MAKKIKMNVLIIGNLHSHPSSEAFLGKFLKIIDAMTDNIVLISSNCPKTFIEKVNWYSTKDIVKKSGHKNLIIKIKNFFIIEAKVLILIMKALGKYKIDETFLLGFSFLGLGFLKLKGIKVILHQGGKPFQIDTNEFFKVLTKIIFEKIPYTLSDKIIVEAKSSITFQNLDKYSYKVVLGAAYVDNGLFSYTKKLSIREKKVGYFGNISEGKGINELIKAFSILEEEMYKRNIKILIVGSGPLKSEIKQKGFKNVELLNWIPHERLSEYLNELNLLVLPSYSEGLPNILLEAMACGTPVLANPVGAIPDIIKDGETGFIMENNSPECIAKNILRALNSPNLNKISKNGMRLVEKEFSYMIAMKRYKKIFDEILS